jgi:hypothetical protein
MELVIFALILVALIAFDFAAFRWGADTRDGFGAVKPPRRF